MQKQLSKTQALMPAKYHSENDELGVQVKVLSVNDAEAIVDLWRQVEGRGQYGLRVLEAQLSQQTNCVYLGAFYQRNNAIGLVTLGWLGGYGRMSGLIVKPTFRRQRVGLHLVNAVCDCAKVRALSHVDLEVARDNEAAISLYHQAGFHAVHYSHETIQYRKACGPD
jgi:ribosomal protein S18 acetylase RimI-like enzyme